MTADAPGTDKSAGDSVLASRLDALDGDATAEHLAVYTEIAGELAARLDEQAQEPTPHPGPPTGLGQHGGVRG